VTCRVWSSFTCGNRNGTKESRTDPFWEFGSFGCTRCHIKNLMNPKRIDELEGVRVAFAQGGQDGHRLVYLTPPVRVVRHKDRCELRWEPSMPFRYADAPVLAGGDGTSDFPLLAKMLASVNRTTLPAKFSSCFRTRRMPLRDELSREMIRVFDRRRIKAKPTMIAAHYHEALPYLPNRIDTARAATYQKLLKKAGAVSERGHAGTSKTSKGSSRCC
jgi:hypothetical protein